MTIIKVLHDATKHLVQDAQTAFLQIQQLIDTFWNSWFFHRLLNSITEVSIGHIFLNRIYLQLSSIIPEKLKYFFRYSKIMSSRKLLQNPFAKAYKLMLENRKEVIEDCLSVTTDLPPEEVQKAVRLELAKHDRKIIMQPIIWFVDNTVDFVRNIFKK